MTRPVIRGMEARLVLHGDVLEQVGHGLLVVDAADGLRQHGRDVHRLDLVALHLLHVVGHRVGYYNLQV